MPNSISYFFIFAPANFSRNFNCFQTLAIICVQNLFTPRIC